ncbi:MAG: 8-oxo-dGTP diphosphatase MutT [Pseudomonadota bacterium]|nr:8-oxo-dGTP diphosphatase MutT [Pseudomonadota bacterium]MED5436774.1 8-oxo-dGTP diphosphatase MutT [Pseudomonadota bacterium]
MQKKDLITVSAVALVDHDGRVLISKRPEGKHMSGFWEFPGGKLEIGETPEECLIREIKEEIDINLSNFCFSPLTFSLNEYDEFNILLLLYVCREWEGIILGKEKQELKWVFPKDLYDKNLLPADKELIPFIRDNISSN